MDVHTRRDSGSGQSLTGAADPDDVSSTAGASNLEYQSVFEAAPGLYLVMRANAPRFTIEAANDAYLAATLTTRNSPSGIVGRAMFEAFPDPPDDPDAMGTRNLRASLERAMASGTSDEMAVQLYAVRRPDGTWEERYWFPLNSPVLDRTTGRVTHLLHRVEDVTEQVRLAAEGERLRGAYDESEMARTSAEAAQARTAAVNAQLEEQALELELANQQLQDQAAELEAQADALRESTATLAESEARFRTVSHASPDAVLLLRPVRDGGVGPVVDFEFMYANEAAGRMLGGGRVDALVGRRMLTLFPNTAPEGYFGAYARAFDTAEPYAREDRYVHEGLDLGVRVAVMRAGDLLHLRVEDIAERLRAAAERERLITALQVEKARLADVFHGAPAFLAVLREPTHVFEMVNDAYYQLVGHRDIVGKPVLEALPEIAGQGFVELLDGVLRTGQPYLGREVPVLLARTPGAPLEERFIDLTYMPLIEADGTRAGVIAHGSDVTAQVQSRREVERLLGESERARADAEAARADAESANRTKGEFLTTMSHELRTPLNAIGGYAELMEMGIRGPVTDQQREDLVRIRLANQHLTGLVTDILNFARLEAGQVAFAVADVPLGPVVAGVEALITPQLVAKGLRFNHDGDGPDTPDQPHIVRADPKRVRQILLNLLSNAVKFTEAGGHITLACETDAAAEVVRIRVTDTGRGIPADQLPRVFEPFVQADRHRTHESQQGIGLGLSISRDLARGMGGELTPESTSGVGSTFTLTLPRGGTRSA